MNEPHYQVVIIKNGIRKVNAVSLMRWAAEQKLADLARLFPDSQVVVELMPGKEAAEPSP